MIAFGSIEAKRKGGLASQQRRRESPGFYRSLGCNVAKLFKKPNFSSDLAEFIGLVLGDGGITEYQIHITLNSVKDREYSVYVAKLIERLFLLKSKICRRKDSKAIVLILSGVNLIRWLKTIDLDCRNKVREQVGVPSWICKDLNFFKKLYERFDRYGRRSFYP